MNEARKDEIGKKFLLSPYILMEECGELEIQELIFLIHSAKYFKEKGAFPGDHLDERIKVFLEVLKDKIKDAESLYIAYEKRTGYPYIDAESRVWMFSKEEYAANAEDYFRQQLLMLEMKKIEREEILKTLGELHIWGLRRIIMDNGQYMIELDRDELLPPPDFSGTPEINIPVTNPGLQQALIAFFQMMSSGLQFEGKQRVLQVMEGRMLDEVIQAKYLLPMQLKEQSPSVPNEQGMTTLKEGTTIQFAVLGGEGDSSWLPVFTDWPEFEKAYDKTVWSSNVVTYDDIVALSDNMDGIVVNYRGIPLQIDDKNKQRIEEYKRERSAAQSEAQHEARNDDQSEAQHETEGDAGGVAPNDAPNQTIQKMTVSEDTEVWVGEPKVYPTPLIDALKTYMKTQKDIKKAYLRAMVKDNEQSYLLIVDFEGNQEEIFSGIAAAASPHLEGIALNLVELDGWANDEVKDLTPFYKKKRFGLL